MIMLNVIKLTVIMLNVVAQVAHLVNQSTTFPGFKPHPIQNGRKKKKLKK